MIAIEAKMTLISPEAPGIESIFSPPDTYVPLHSKLLAASKSGMNGNGWIRPQTLRLGSRRIGGSDG